MSKTPPPGPPIKRQPRQKRSQVLVQSLLEAARLILDREGQEALTTNHIAEVAGVSIGSLYHYFTDKDAIVEAIFLAEEEQSIRQRIGWAAEAIDLPLEEMFRLFIERIAEQHRRLLEMHKGLYLRHQEHTDVRRLADARAAPSADGRHAVEIFLQAWCERHVDEIRPRRIEQAAFLLDRVGYSMMRATVDERPEYLSDPAYVEEMVQLLVRYLRAD